MGKMILIVDDEKAIVDILTLNLNKAGYETVSAYDGRTGLRMALERSPDLILLDIMLPYMDGYTVCKEFRQKDKLTPVIMLTAREEEQDMVFGLELGADDYITKPFSVRELLARVRTNIRRGAVVGEMPGASGVTLGRLTIDDELSQVYKDGKPIDLTQREYDLFHCLARQPDKVFSREELMQEVWHYDYYGDLRAVDVAVRRLREKVEDDAAAPEYILTKRGAGYFFSTPR